MKPGFSALNIQIPTPTKRIYEQEAKRRMVTVTALCRAILCANAPAKLKKTGAAK